MVASRLSDDEQNLIDALSAKHRTALPELKQLDRYYDGEQRLKHIGIALPEELHDFQVVVDVPRMAVDEPVLRQELKAFQRSGSSQVDPVLREAWEANNLDAQAPLVHTDARVFGRSLVSVSTNDEDAEHPLILGEDPRQFAFDVDRQRRRMTAALKLSADDGGTLASAATLYLPDDTLWLARNDYGAWEVTGRDRHDLGRVPLVTFLNKARTGRHAGRSEMASVIGLTDAAARIITNAQVAAETHAVPTRWVAGLARKDFVDENGDPLPLWESYFTELMATSNQDAKFGQFTASQLSNFTDTVDRILAWCAGSLGFPVRFMGQSSTNPASEGAIVADEVRLIRNVEMKNTLDGASWCWVMGLYERLRTGEWLPTNSVRALWQNPATPTRAQMADAAVKLHQAGVLSREGVWDEWGWDEARKDRERAYFAAEQADPAIEQIMRGLDQAATPIPAA